MAQTFAARGTLSCCRARARSDHGLKFDISRRRKHGYERMRGMSRCCTSLRKKQCEFITVHRSTRPTITMLLESFLRLVLRSLSRDGKRESELSHRLSDTSLRILKQDRNLSQSKNKNILAPLLDRGLPVRCVLRLETIFVSLKRQRLITRLMHSRALRLRQHTKMFGHLQPITSNYDTLRRRGHSEPCRHHGYSDRKRNRQGGKAGRKISALK